MKFVRLSDRAYILKQCRKINIYIREENGALKYEELNETAYEILDLVNKGTSIIDISKKLADKYNEKISDVQEIVQNFLIDCRSKGYIEISTGSKISKNKIFGDVNMIIPHHMLIETTYSCPLECRHCINESGIHRTERIPSDVLIETLNKLSECMISEIERCCNKNILWQISIDGNEETHNHIRCNRQAYKRAINAIKILKKYDFFVSISSTIHKDNIDQMEDIYKYIKESGADRLRYGIIIEKGRAEKNNISINNEFLQRLNAIRKKYKHENLLINEDLSQLNMNIKKEKCDLGVYILSIKATGDIVACPGFDLSLGNINQSSLESILSSKKADILLDLKSPTKSLCGDCSSIQECKGCHAVPLNKKSNVCSWKIQNKNILDEFLEVEKVTY